MIRTLIVDDEPVARRGIRQRLSSEPDITIVGECGDGADAIAAIGELTPDLVFLDIQMPGLDGFAVIEAVGLQRMPAVIFVTAFDQHAVRAFDVHAVDYVLKPVDGDRFRAALDRARATLRDTDDRLAERIAAALAELGHRASPRWTRRLAIKSEGRVTLVDIRDVDRMETAGNYVEVHAGGAVHLLRETMTSLEARLDPQRFARVSRTALVNLDKVREVQAMFNGDFVLVLRDGSEVSGSRRFRTALDALLR
ncbi:LytR/AlgR family response regulator transcription factor [Tahibacter amnicola]|uniref:LytTR family DNA-binding domain-containing protein n=1 Tax=Tahibacter amnicola TaxID=2976241 RepID=A0ABY6B6P7_9GAMM|nr:LytTR family DNA-binding domain-containing protein [Tahibacter amnicola]UXI65778.1 LytTR family DNA-binding domain-containing protein [Tahibacter amnicola]